MHWSGVRIKPPWLFALIGTVAGTALLLLPRPGSDPAPGAAGWASEGCFVPGGAYPTTYLDPALSARQKRGLTLWGSYCGSDASTGSLRSPVFQAPAVLELLVAGYLGVPGRGFELYLERIDNGARMPLTISSPSGEAWVRHEWWTPADIRDHQVRLIAIDRDRGFAGWFGVSNPRSYSQFSFSIGQILISFHIVATYTVQLALFLLPGFVLASWVSARRSSAPIYAPIITILTGAALSYLSFWSFFFSHRWGKHFTFAVDLTAILFAALPSLIPRAALKRTARALCEPLSLTFLAGLCYVSFYFLFGDPFTLGIAYGGDRFFREMLPGDCVIPEILADRIFDRRPVIPFCCGDWLSSDRPPLQSGAVLLERPISLGIARNRDLAYELLATALQCFWICGLWCFLTALGTPRARIRQVIGFLIFSGFLFFNSVYVWPKLLAATFILFLFAILIDTFLKKRPLDFGRTALAAVCLGSALVTHPGAVFSVVAGALLLIPMWRSFTPSRIVLAVLIVAAFGVPWTLYQKYVDPPGNRLMKIHLAGVIPIDTRTTLQTLRDSYRAASWRQIAFNKWANVVELTVPRTIDSYGLTAVRGTHIDHAVTEKSRSEQRVFMPAAEGLVNLGWLAAIWLLFRRPKAGLAIPYAGFLIAAAAINFLFWSLITFGPYETQTAHSSYADILLWSAGLLGLILTLPRLFFTLLFCWQLLNFFVVWVFSAPARLPQPIVLRWPMLISGIAVTVALAWITLREPKTEPA